MYVIIAVTAIVLIVVIGFFVIYSSAGRDYLSDSVEEGDHREYHKEKHEKIKAQYYRSIDLEQPNQRLEYDARIVGIAKPQGKWTSMVIRRNMQYMTTLKHLMGTNFSKIGIWQLRLKAQSLISQGMHRGRGK
ncbi:hypothetical protein [Neorickettsia helminthoeca]|uniref:hypothetical protein n=1 Tax=Neorickettsia helminthoeca TaxID=33994 RepID=UPI0018DE6117|nr:hypothetical protein [Neorickettsia helminthoeca]